MQSPRSSSEFNMVSKPNPIPPAPKKDHNLYFNHETQSWYFVKA